MMNICGALSYETESNDRIFTWISLSGIFYFQNNNNHYSKIAQPVRLLYFQMCAEKVWMKTYDSVVAPFDLHISF